MIKGLRILFGLAILGVVFLVLLGTGLIVPVLLFAVVGSFAMYIIKSFAWQLG